MSTCPFGKVSSALGVRFQEFGVHAFVQHLDLGLVGGWELAFLPRGGGDGHVALLQGQQVVGAPSAHAQPVVQRCGELRVKAHVGAVGGLLLHALPVFKCFARS